MERAILFDLDDTLIEDAAANTAAFRDACALARDNYGLDPAALATAVGRTAGQLWRAAPTIGYCRAIGISSTEGLRAAFTGDDPTLARLRDWAPWYRHAAWAGGLAACGVRDAALADRLADAYVVARGARNRVYPDVVPTLLALARGQRLALVTNGAPDIQRAKLAASGLAPHFAAVIVSGELGAGKPDARPFHAALAALGVAPHRTIMVGDSLERDVVGAHNAGLRAILLDRAGTTPPAGRGGVATIGSLRELLALV